MSFKHKLGENLASWNFAQLSFSLNIFLDIFKLVKKICQQRWNLIGKLKKQKLYLRIPLLSPTDWTMLKCNAPQFKIVRKICHSYQIFQFKNKILSAEYRQHLTTTTYVWAECTIQKNLHCGIRENDWGLTFKRV